LGRPGHTVRHAGEEHEHAQHWPPLTRLKRSETHAAPLVPPSDHLGLVTDRYLGAVYAERRMRAGSGDGWSVGSRGVVDAGTSLGERVSAAAQGAAWLPGVAAEVGSALEMG